MEQTRKIAAGSCTCTYNTGSMQQMMTIFQCPISDILMKQLSPKLVGDWSAQEGSPIFVCQLKRHTV